MLGLRVRCQGNNVSFRVWGSVLRVNSVRIRFRVRFSVRVNVKFWA